LPQDSRRQRINTALFETKIASNNEQAGQTANFYRGLESTLFKMTVPQSKLKSGNFASYAVNGALPGALSKSSVGAK
jgi:hypothetical protein